MREVKTQSNIRVGRKDKSKHQLKIKFVFSRQAVKTKQADYPLHASRI